LEQRRRWVGAGGEVVRVGAGLDQELVVHGAEKPFYFSSTLGSAGC
jgi:hypothetical protein